MSELQTAVINLGANKKYIKNWPTRRLLRFVETGGKNMKKDGVGAYCRQILARVVDEVNGHPVGLGYGEMVTMVQKKFPNSRADERHLRWYASHLRAEGKSVPAHRRRTYWSAS